MRVAINLTVEVDEEAWKAAYGLETNAEVREDVKTYVRTTLSGVEIPLVPVR